MRVAAVDFGYRRRRRLVLRQLMLTFDDRSTVIVGPNGAGKSTLLRLLAGQLQPTRGSVSTPVEVGYSPQRPVTLSAFTVSEQAQYAAWLNGMARGRVREAARNSLALVRMDDLADQPATSLSGGQAQRLGIACALVTTPRVVLLDEPTASLDPIARASITEVLCDLVAQGLTIVATSHTATDIGSPFDRLLLMSDGSVAYDGDPAGFLSGEHDDPVAEQFARALRVR